MKKGREARKRRYRNVLEPKFTVKGKSRFLPTVDGLSVGPLEVETQQKKGTTAFFKLYYKGVYVGYRTVIDHEKKAKRVKDHLAEFPQGELSHV